MKKSIKLHYNSSVDPAFNLALEELLATQSPNEHFMLWRNGPSIIVGKNQNTAAEINADAVRANNVHVIRRVTGGGAVYHDLGNINFSYVSASSEWNSDSSALYTAPIVSVLRSLGIDAAFAGRNDILADGCKVSGCARSVLKDRTLFHGTLLFNTDLTVLSRVLNPDPEKIRSKGIKSVRARVGNMIDMLKTPLTMDDFITVLRRGVCDYFGVAEESPIPHDILTEAETLADSRYRTWDWNYGTNLKYTFSNTARFASGRVIVEMNIHDNRIADLHFSGDFFGSHPVQLLADRLNGVHPRREDILAVLRTLNLSDYIAGITPDELAGLLSIE